MVALVAPVGRMSELSSCPQPMATVVSTVLGLIQNLRAFGGILVVSPGCVVGGGPRVGLGVLKEATQAGSLPWGLSRGGESSR